MFPARTNRPLVQERSGERDWFVTEEPGDCPELFHPSHRAGESCFVDHAGPTVSIVDPKTGELHPAALFVAVLGASDYTYAEATRKRDLAGWIGSHVRALEFFGGVPAAIVPDNWKTGVKD